MIIQDQSPYEVAPVEGHLGADTAHYGICLHEECRSDDGRSRYRKKRGSAGQAEAAVLDHLRDKHGLEVRRG